MVEVLPLNGLFFNKEKIKNISDVISPPYDVIPKPLRKKLHSLDPHNIINLILPGGSGREKYINAQKLLNDWVKNNILIFDDRKCFYVFEEYFSAGNMRKKITGFIGLTRIEPYSFSNIIPHERTRSEPKLDRLNLLESCRTNFGIVYTLYRDDENKTTDIFKITMKEKPFINTPAGYDPSLNFKIWKLDKASYIKELRKIMKDKKLVIADGHHRYETSLFYKQKYGSTGKKNARNPEDFILTLYVKSDDKNIIIHPNHRLIKFKKYPGIDAILDKIKSDFSIEAIEIGSDKSAAGKLLEARSRRLKSFFIYGGPKNSYFITLKSHLSRIRNILKAHDSGYMEFDVIIMKKFLIEKISGHLEIEKISYTHYISNVIKRVDNNKFDIGILLNAPTVKEVEKISSNGQILPDKSTYFYPKPCTGLIMYKFDR